jgi:hypothetical protein
MDHKEIGCRWNWSRTMCTGESGSADRDFECGNFYV